MILNQKEVIEKYPNGKIKYIETIAEISKMWIAKYPNHRKSNDGKLWIRIGINKKYRPNGKLQWEIKYDDCGNIIKQP